MTEKEYLIKTIIELLQNCEDKDLLYLIQSLFY